MKASGQQVSELDAIRGIAALTVAIWHWFSMARIKEGWFTTTADSLHRASEFAVTTFFVLSGCVLTLSILRAKDTPPFELLTGYFLRRTLRILPPVFLVATTAFVGMWLMREIMGIETQWRRYTDFSASRYFQNILLVDTHFNPPGWTLRFEVAAYLLLPFLILAFLKNGIARWVYASVFVVLVYFVGTYWTGWKSFFQLMPTFLPGIALALAPANRSGAFAYAAIGVLGLGFLAQIEQKHYDMSLLVAISCACLIASGMNATNHASQVLTHPALKRLGDISYGVYLWHYPILWALFYLTGEFVGTRHVPTFFLVGAIGLPLTFIVSHISYTGFERPIINLGRRSLSGRRKLNKRLADAHQTA